MFYKCSWLIIPFGRTGQKYCLWAKKIFKQFYSGGNWDHNSEYSCIKALQDYHWLFECAPSFCIDGDNVHVLREPSEFYDTLKVKYRNLKLFRNQCMIINFTISFSEFIRQVH